MAGSNDSAAKIENGIEIDDARRSFVRHNSQVIKDDGDHHRDKQLEETLNPKMNNPKSPRIHYGKVRITVEEKRRQVEQRNRDGGVEKQGCDFTTLFRATALSDAPEKQNKPNHEP